MIHTSLRPAAYAGLAATLLLIGCGGSRKDRPASRTPANPTPAPAPAPAQAMQPGLWRGQFQPDQGPAVEAIAPVLPDGTALFQWDTALFRTSLTRDQGPGEVIPLNAGPNGLQAAPGRFQVTRGVDASRREVSLQSPSLRGTFTLTHHPEERRAITFQDLQNRWQSQAGDNLLNQAIALEVDLTGRVTSQITGQPPSGEGRITIPDPTWNLFTVTFTGTADSQANPIRGIGYLGRGANGQDQLTVIATDGQVVFKGKFTR